MFDLIVFVAVFALGTANAFAGNSFTTLLMGVLAGIWLANGIHRLGE